jgi:ATP-binding cassette subfamily D (ALD) protein 3
VFALKFSNGIIDSVLVKYCATQLAFFILSRPVFGRNADQYAKERVGADSTRIMEDYSTNSGYLINLSQAVGRLVLAGRDLTRFAGYTFRVAEFFSVLDDINSGRYQRTMVSSDPSGINEVKTVDEISLGGKVIETEDGYIEFQNVPICTPNGDILVPAMSFKVERGMNCLITGPNGCGKSSLFRILGGLWPVFGGTLVKPTACNMFYVPQKPYLTLGSLRDQLIYPDTQSEAHTRGFNDENLLALLGKVNLEYLVPREGGWDAVRDWADVLSGGEKQRVAMARLFYHRPHFAILDECTSAVSIDVEGQMYRYARELGITLFTVSHRPSLVPFHEYLLRFDGSGGYYFEELRHGEPFAFASNKRTSSSEEQPLNDGGVNYYKRIDYFEEEQDDEDAGMMSDDEL